MLRVLANLYDIVNFNGEKISIRRSGVKLHADTGFSAVAYLTTVI